MALKLAPVMEAAPGAPGADDQLLAAVIGKLPNVGQAFPAAARRDWLSMLTMALNVVYGAEDVAMPETPADAATPAPAKPPKKPHELSGFDYYVDHEGYARCDTEKDELGGPPRATPGRRVTAEEVAGQDEPLYDYRGAARDRTTVVWADDEVGALAGMAFAGPG